jgi:hypothetical protein
MKRGLILTLAMFGFFSCSKNSKFSNIPKLTFNSFSVNNLMAGKDTTIFAYIDFEDGDGDMGINDSNNLYFIDMRDTDTVGYPIPVIEERFEPKRGVSGSIQVALLGSTLIFRDTISTRKSDTIVWNIYVKDAAGNVSNLITTPPLYLAK